jgi:hypothetical protein
MISIYAIANIFIAIIEEAYWSTKVTSRSPMSSNLIIHSRVEVDQEEVVEVEIIHMEWIRYRYINYPLISLEHGSQ